MTDQLTLSQGPCSHKRLPLHSVAWSSQRGLSKDSICFMDLPMTKEKTLHKRLMIKSPSMLSQFICVLLFATLWTVPSMEFSMSCPPAGDLLDPRIKPASLTSPALTGGFFITSTT